MGEEISVFIIDKGVNEKVTVSNEEGGFNSQRFFDGEHLRLEDLLNEEGDGGYEVTWGKGDEGKKDGVKTLVDD